MKNPKLQGCNLWFLFSRGFSRPSL